MPMENDIGISITIPIKRRDPITKALAVFDLTDATTKEIIIKPPNAVGTAFVASLVGAATLGVLRYTTDDTADLVNADNVDQVWEKSAHVAGPGYNLTTIPTKFTLRKKLEVAA